MSLSDTSDANSFLESDMWNQMAAPASMSLSDLQHMHHECVCVCVLTVLPICVLNSEKGFTVISHTVLQTLNYVSVFKTTMFTLTLMPRCHKVLMI